MRKSKETIKRDIRDIRFIVDHTSAGKIRESALVDLGYVIGYNIVIDESPIKSYLIGKQGEYRVQIEEKKDNFPLVKCAVVKID